MSDSEKEDHNTDDEEPEKTEEEIAKEVEEKCWEAFLVFDKAGDG